MWETLYQLRTSNDETYRGAVVPRGHVILAGHRTLAEVVAERDAWERRARAALGRLVRAEVWANEPRQVGPGRWSLAWRLVA